MLERIILIVDDNPRVESVYIPAYLSELNILKNNDSKWCKYNFNLIHKKSMEEALEYLESPCNFVDVLVVDYDFGGEKSFSNGTAFVKSIRENVNRYCQVVFYTMQGMDSIDKKELIDLINSDVFKMVDKSQEPKEMAQVLFEAATSRNPVVESLERFFIKYKALLSTYKYSIDGQLLTFDQIIKHIRMDDKEGRIFVEKLLQKAILLQTNIED